MLQRVMSRVSVETFCLTLPKKFVSKPLSVSLISVIEKVYASGGYVTNLRRTFFVPQNRTTLQGNPSVLFQKFLVAKYFRIRRRAKYQDFPSKVFCLTVPEFFVGQSFRVSKFSCLEKFHASEGFVTIFCRNFLSHSVEKFRR